MKKYMLMLAIAGLSLATMATPPAKKADVSFKVDAAASTLKWNAKKVTGQHSGIAKLSSGTIVVNGKTLKSAEINVDMNSIDATDLQGEYHDKLVGHLKSDDFFAVAKYTTATLKVKSATAIKDAAAGSNNYTIVADLTIKGITKEITFPAMIIFGNEQTIVNADFDIDRTEYDIKYGSGKFITDIGDKAIMDKFNIKVRVVANK